MNDGAVKDLYEKYGHLIYGRCLRILGSEDDAWDGVQTVFLKLLRSIETIRDPERIVAWIFTAATNHCFNLLRERKKSVAGLEADEVAVHDRFDKRVADRQLINILVGAQDRRVREAVYYTYVEGLEQKEIQRVSGQSPATVRRNLRKFKEHCERLTLRLDVT